MTDTDRQLLMKHLKEITFPDEEFVSLIVKWMKEHSIDFECAPFEAEWQLAFLEREGALDFVYSSDGDAIILGIKRLITNIDFKKENCVIVERDGLVKSGKFPLCQYPFSMWPNIACLLSCDYIARVHGTGAITLFNKILQQPQMRGG